MDNSQPLSAAPTARILYAEDDGTLAMLYKTRMQMEGWSVQIAEDGTSAVELAKAFRPDVILLDLMMPNMDGFDVIKQLRAHIEMAPTRILVLTALNQADDVTKATELGANGFLVKSQVTVDEIVAEVRRQLEQPITPAAPAQ